MRKESKEQEYSDNKVFVYVKNMSSFEKLFWIILFLFSIVYIVLISMASYSSSSLGDGQNTSVMIPDEIIQEIEVIVTSERIKKNLENNRIVEEIEKNLKYNMLILDKKIDKEINKVYHGVYSSVDSFLDFHYSVIGEYIELGGMATGTMEKMIEQKLFGSDFSRRLQDAIKVTSDEYEIKLSEHFNFINQKATIRVDMNLNSHILNDLKEQIDQNMKLQGGKIGVLISAKFAPKLVQMATVKITAKTGSKFAAKTAAKAGAKSAAAATGATAGTLCGPAFWICSPIAAGILWFGTDAVIVNIDEIYNKEGFRQDIMDVLEEQKNDLKEKLKLSYRKTAHKLSDEIIIKYKQAPIKEIKRVKIKEKMGL